MELEIPPPPQRPLEGIGMAYERKELECKTCGLQFKKVAHLMVHSKTHRNESPREQEKAATTPEDYDQWIESFADRLVALTQESMETDADTDSHNTNTNNNSNQSQSSVNGSSGSETASRTSGASDYLRQRFVPVSHEGGRRPSLRRSFSVPPPPTYPPFEDHRSTHQGRRRSFEGMRREVPRRRHTLSGGFGSQGSRSQVLARAAVAGSSRRLVGELSGKSAPTKAFKDAAEAVRLGNSAMYHHFGRSDADTAARYYKESLKLAPRNTSLMGNYALLLQHEMKDFDAAEQIYTEATSLDPTNATLLANYASFLKTVRKDIEQADMLYERAVKADPQHAGNLGNYAAFLHRYKGDMNGAKDLFECALELDPRHANNLTRYASLLKKGFNDYSNAKRLYEQAISIEPQNANTLTNFANLLRAQAEAARSDANEESRELLLRHAQALYQDAIAANPDNLLVKRNYKALLQDLPLPKRKSGGHLHQSG